MNGIDQYSLLNSLNEALMPGSSLIDGRTEQDRLCFFAEFASVINFYDEENNIKGNWAPFMLKDPIFLLASISKTRFAQIHNQYLETCHRLKVLIDDQKNEVITDLVAISNLFNQLFDQLIRVFICIKRWIYYMQRSNEVYDLKTYVIDQTKTNISAYYWAVIALRQNLSISSAITGIQFSDPTKFYLFEHNEKLIWKQDKDKSPYWEILDLDNPITKNSDGDFYNALTKTGDIVFDFFQTIIQHSSVDYEKLSKRRSQYPDTTLLRGFVELLQIQQAQLNGISAKHLQFYYKDILKQTERTAVPDSAYVFCELAKPGTTFNLPSGTLFNAGLDAEKRPVVFTTTGDVNLNSASITEAFTLGYVSGAANPNAFYLQKIATPSIVQKNSDGAVQSWPTFGGYTALPGALVMPAIVFASPMFLLREGTRIIQLTISYTGNADVQMMNSASYYLSTQKDWVKVTAVVKAGTSPDSLIITISPDGSYPPIEAFAKNPDGFQSNWPMLKIEFSALSKLSAPPVINSLNITVSASDFKTFQLYNNDGALSTKTPYQLFGPTPALNSSFLIGSDEIFSKPLNDINFEFDWNNILPGFNFKDYYAQYNDYLYSNESFFTRVKQRLSTLVKKQNVNEYNSENPFNNCCFKVNFQLLQNHNWQDFSLHASQKCVCVPGKDNDTIAAWDGSEITSETLFATDAAGNLVGKSTFAYNNTGDKFIYDPGIQDTPLKFTDSSLSGFVKMELCDPVYGFGMELYSNIIYQIALDNAISLQKWFDKSFKQTAVLPFAPKLNQLSASYSASQTYTFNPAVDDYPLECYLYGAFEKYKIYDGTTGPIPGSYTISTTENIASGTGVPLFAPMDYMGYLFLGMDDLVPAAGLSIYFELTRKYEINNVNDQIEYYYLSINGWQSLSLLSDGTNNFNCSGIIKLNVPGDITNQSQIMPDNKFWFAIAVKTNPETFPHTVIVKTNAFNVTRSGTEFLTDSQIPVLAANAITKPKNPIPQIATVLQPFASFGGAPAENEATMNSRICARMETKDRAVDAGDYFTMVRQQFNDIYFAKTVFDKITRKIGVYVVKAYADWTDASAFMPLITACREEMITEYLKEKTSAFAQVEVSNFDMQYVKITCIAMISQGFECQGMQKNINQLLNIYLSPWITNHIQQVQIGVPVNDTQIAKFIKSINGVSEVLNVSFQTWMKSGGDLAQSKASLQDNIVPLSPVSLLISCMNHDIQCIAI
ncbi:hypothetical protein [Mucilaginibacter sp. L196]|uniref:hypothetical protein n=1 Tax=Mucilaginibacter sp. L196 TaxID=1641870 RepID=UPI00131BA8C1|nr:hypothetical protein [Mucilaginibacter sp. L196]